MNKGRGGQIKSYLLREKKERKKEKKLKRKLERKKERKTNKEDKINSLTLF